MIREFGRRAIDRARAVLRGRGPGLILLYHRIIHEPTDPYGLCVGPDRFEQHLQVLTRGGYRVRPVSQLAHDALDGSLSDRTIGITFDDAYVDVLDNAVPLLTRYDVPATVFATTGPGGREREFWWDELERACLGSVAATGTLEIEVAGRAHHWQLDDDARAASPGELPARWHLFDDPAPTRRHEVFRELYLLLRPLHDDVRGPALSQMLTNAGDDPAHVRPARRVMTPAQVGALRAEGLVEIGAHTVTHPDLPSQPAPIQLEEAARSRATLEAWTGARVPGFAYPYGLYDDGSVAAARESGFDFACAGNHEPVRPGNNRLLLPRVDVPDVDGEGLSTLLRRYVG